MPEFSLMVAIETAIWLFNQGVVVLMLALGTTVGTTVLVWIVREIKDLDL